LLERFVQQLAQSGDRCLLLLLLLLLLATVDADTGGCGGMRDCGGEQGQTQTVRFGAQLRG
jgi:hypothetical protein